MQHLGSTLVQLQISDLRKRHWHAYTIPYDTMRNISSDSAKAANQGVDDAGRIVNRMHPPGVAVEDAAWCSMSANYVKQKWHLAEMVHVKITGDFCILLWLFKRNVLIITDRLETLEYLDWNIEARIGKKKFPSKRDVHQSQRLNRALLALLQCDPKLGAGFHRADSTARLRL